MRKIMLISLVALLPLLGTAQSKQANDEAVNSKASWKGFVTNRFWDNWFISVGAGGQMYFGEYDSEPSFGKRLSPSFDLSVGKWLMPTLGARLQVSGFTLRGATNDPNNIYATWLTGIGNYRQRWRQFNMHVDGLLNLSNWIGGYRTDRFYEAVPFAGFGFIHGCSSADNTAFMFTAGLLNKMRISDAFDVNVELRGSLVPQDFDGEVGGSKGEGILSLTAGISYKFNQRKFRKEQKTKLVPTGISKEDLRAVEDKLAAESQRAAKLQKDLDQSRRDLDEARKAGQKKDVELVTSKLTVFFEINRTALSAKEKVNLRNYAEMIKSTPDKKYTVTGYADKSTGSDKYNQKLSEKRAQAVVDFLVKECGVNSNQLIASGKGGVDAKDAVLGRAVVIELSK